MVSIIIRASLSKPYSSYTLSHAPFVCMSVCTSPLFIRPFQIINKFVDVKRDSDHVESLRNQACTKFAKTEVPI